MLSSTRSVPSSASTTSLITSQKQALVEVCWLFLPDDGMPIMNKRKAKPHRTIEQQAIHAICDELNRTFSREEKREREITDLQKQILDLSQQQKEIRQQYLAIPTPSAGEDSASQSTRDKLSGRFSQLESNITALNGIIENKEAQLVQLGMTGILQIEELQYQIQPMLEKAQLNLNTSSFNFSQSLPTAYSNWNSFIEKLIQLHAQSFQLFNFTITRIEEYQQDISNKIKKIQQSILPLSSINNQQIVYQSLQREHQLNSSFASYNGKLNALEDKGSKAVTASINTLDLQINQTQKVLRQIQDRMDLLSQSQHNHSVSQISLRHQVESLQNSTTQLTLNVYKIQYQIQEIQKASLESINSRLYRIEKQLNHTQTSSASLGTADSAHILCSALRGDVGRLERFKETVENEFTRFAGEINQIKFQYSHLHNTISQLSAKVDALNRTVSDHTRQLGTHDRRISSLNQSVIQLSTNMDVLDETVGQHSRRYTMPRTNRVEKENTEKLRYLILGELFYIPQNSYGPNLNTMIFYDSIRHNDSGIAQEVQDLILHGADPNQLGGLCQSSLLHEVVRRNLTKTANVLLQYSRDFHSTAQASTLCYAGQNALCDTDWKNSLATFRCLLTKVTQENNTRCFNAVGWQIEENSSQNYSYVYIKNLLYFTALHSTPSNLSMSYRVSIDQAPAFGFATYSEFRRKYFDMHNSKNIMDISSFIKTAVFGNDALDYYLLFIAEILARQDADNEFVSILLREEILRKDPALLTQALEGPYPCIEGRSAAFAAVENDNVDLLRKILQKDSSPIHQRDSHGRMLVHIAALKNRLNTLRYLAQQNASLLTLPDHHNATPMDLAIYATALAAITVLKANNVTFPSSYNHHDIDQLITPFIQQAKLTLAPTRAHYELFDCTDTYDELMELKAHLPEDLYPIHTKIKKRDSNAVERYLNTSCVDPNWKDDQGRTLLYVTIQNFNPYTTFLLFKEGANANLPDKNGTTPLHAAVKKNLTQVVDYFLSQRRLGVNIDLEIAEVPWNNITALYSAAELGHIYIVGKLLDAGANVNAATKTGDTPAHRAAYRCHPEIVEKLLAHGASLLKKNHANHTPFDLSNCGPSNARKMFNLCKKQFKHYFNFTYPGSNYKSCWRELKGKISEAEAALTNISCTDTRHYLQSLKNTLGYYPIHRAAEQGDIDTVQQYLNASCSDVNWQDFKGNTLMHRATLGGQVNISQLIYKNRADLSLKNNKNYTALHSAVYEKQLDIVKKITEWAHTDPTAFRILDMEDYKVPTALYIASSNRRVDMVEALVRAGANTSICTQKKNWCPIHQAIENCDDKVASVLLNSSTSFLSMLTQDKVQNKLPTEVLRKHDYCSGEKILALCIGGTIHEDQPCSWDMVRVLRHWCTDTLKQHISNNITDRGYIYILDLYKKHANTLRTQYFARQSSQSNQTRSKRSLPDSTHFLPQETYENITRPAEGNRSAASNKTELEVSLGDLKEKFYSLVKESQRALFPSAFGFANGFADQSMNLYIPTDTSPNQRLGTMLAVHLGLKGFAYTINMMDETGWATASFLTILRDGLSIKASWVQAHWGEITLRGLKGILWLAEQLSTYSLTTFVTSVVPSLREANTFDECWDITRQFVLFQIGIPLILHQLGYVLGEMSVSIVPTVPASITSALKTAANTVFSSRFFHCAERNVPTYMRNRWFTPKKTDFEMK